MWDVIECKQVSGFILGKQRHISNKIDASRIKNDLGPALYITDNKLNKDGIRLYHSDK